MFHDVRVFHRLVVTLEGDGHLCFWETEVQVQWEESC
jgi:hypothetical protein